jgi:hypothetical protein
VELASHGVTRAAQPTTRNITPSHSAGDGGPVDIPATHVTHKARHRIWCTPANVGRAGSPTSLARNHESRGQMTAFGVESIGPVSVSGCRWPPLGCGCRRRVWPGWPPRGARRFSGLLCGRIGELASECIRDVVGLIHLAHPATPISDRSPYSPNIVPTRDGRRTRSSEKPLASHQIPVVMNPGPKT